MRMKLGSLRVFLSLQAYLLITFYILKLFFHTISLLLFKFTLHYLFNKRETPKSTQMGVSKGEGGGR